MPDLRFQLCKINADCPACLEVDTTTFPIATAWMLFQLPYGTIARLQYVRDEISGIGDPLTYLDPELLLEIFLQHTETRLTFEFKLSWASAHIGTGDFKLYLYAKAGTVITGRLFVP